MLIFFRGTVGVWCETQPWSHWCSSLSVAAGLRLGFVKLLTLSLSLGGCNSFSSCSRKGMLNCKPGAAIIFFEWFLRIVRIGSGLWRSSSAAPLPRQGHLGKCSLSCVFSQLCSLCLLDPCWILQRKGLSTYSKELYSQVFLLQHYISKSLP